MNGPPRSNANHRRLCRASVFAFLVIAAAAPLATAGGAVPPAARTGQQTTIEVKPCVT